jgi:hypothetical protein
MRGCRRRLRPWQGRRRLHRRRMGLRRLRCMVARALVRCRVHLATLTVVVVVVPVVALGLPGQVRRMATRRSPRAAALLPLHHTRTLGHRAPRRLSRVA